MTTNDLDSVQAALACELGALDASQRQRQGQVLEALGRLVRSVEELPDGYGLQLPANEQALLLSAEFIANERLCCPFFHFNLDVAAQGAPLRLRLTGGPGVKEFLRAELADLVTGVGLGSPTQSEGDSHV